MLSIPSIMSLILTQAGHAAEALGDPTGGGAGGAVQTTAKVAKPAPPGALAKWIPNTGYQSIDAAVDTLAHAVMGLATSFLRMLPQIVIAIVVLILTAVAAALLHRFSRNVFRKMRLRESLRELFAQFIYIGVWFAGIMIAAAIVFPDFGPGQMIAAAGLASIAIGFAFKDIFENFFAGILILWRFPFNTGDFIQVESVDGVEGKVEDIWIRMTLIRRTNGELVLVPNATIYKNPVRVLTSMRSRRLSITTGIAYGEDIVESRKVITSAVNSCPSVHKDRPVQVFAHGFGASSIDFEVAWWTGSTPLDHRRSRDEVVEAIKRDLDAAGIEIPYPYRTLVFSKNEPDIIEAVGRRAADGGGGGNG